MKAKNPLEYLKAFNQWAMEDESTLDLRLLTLVTYTPKTCTEVRSCTIPSGLHFSCLLDMDVPGKEQILIYGNLSNLCFNEDVEMVIFIKDITELHYPSLNDDYWEVPDCIAIDTKYGIHLDIIPTTDLVIPSFDDKF